MSRRTRRLVQRVEQQCRYRTLIGRNLDIDDPDVAARVRLTLAVTGDGPMPIDAADMAEVIACLQDGGVVYLIADRPALRDAAKAAILATASQQAGRA